MKYKYLLKVILQTAEEIGLKRKHSTEESRATLIDESDKWYNAFEEDIAVANFFITKPTAFGKRLLLDNILTSQVNFRVQEDREHGNY